MQPKTLICPNPPCRSLLARLPDAWPGPQMTGACVREPEVPFPVETPFVVRPDLTKLNGGSILVEDEQWHAWMNRKRAAIVAGELPLLDEHVAQDQWQSLTRSISQVLAELVPNGPIDAHGRFIWLGNPRIDHPQEFFCALSLSLQEDFALMVPDAEGRLLARALSVAFPSGWNPRHKLGMPLMSIHAPVADNAALQKATPSIEQAMLTKGPFVRHVWTLAGSGALKRDAGEDTLAHATTIEDLWYRCERQVTVPVDGLACLFLIRVFVAPLAQVLASPGRGALLKASLASMSPEMMAYKGIRRAAMIVLESGDV